MEREENKKVYLEDLDFLFEGAHIAYTDGNGAASLLNEAYLFKSLVDNKNISHKDEKDSISQTVDKEIESEDSKGKEEMPTKKVADEKVDETASIQKEMKDMKKAMQDLQKELKEAKRELAVVEVAKSVKGFGFEDELAKEVSDVLVDLTDEQNGVVSKAFTHFEEIIKTLKTEKEEAENKVEEENPLAKALTEEVGHSETTDGVETEDAANDFIAEIKKAQEK